MYQIKHQGNFYNLPVSTTKSDEILDRLKSILRDENQEFILSFNNIFLSRKVNYNLLEIGYSPQEIIDVTESMKIKSFFKIADFNFTCSLANCQYSTVFVAKQFFADQFYTVPENIIIKYENKELLDSNEIMEYYTDEDTAFQVSVNEEYFLVRTYLNKFHFACLKLNSTVENLKETISMYSQKVNSIEFQCVYSDNLKEICKQNNIEDESEIDTKNLQGLASLVPVFEFTKSTENSNKKFTITIKIKDEKFNKAFIKKYSSTERISLYSLTILIERDLRIDRSLFIPFNQDGTKMKLTEFASPNKNNFIFKIFHLLDVKILNSFDVKTDKTVEKISYLTTIHDFQEKCKFEKHNFGIIINNHYVYEKKEDNKFLIVHFMNKTKEPTDINIQYSLEPSYFITFTKVEPTIKIKTHFIIPKSMKSDQIAIIYLHQNVNSIKTIKRDKGEITYKNSERQKVNYTLIDKKKEVSYESIEIIGQNIRVIDLLNQIYNNESTRNIFGINFHIKFFRKYYVAIPTFKGKKLNFWELLSNIFNDEQNKIIIEYFEEENDMFILNLYNNSKTFDRISFKDRNSSTEIIINYCKEKGISVKDNLNLYADFNKLRKTDIPSLFKHENSFLILNQESDKKKLIIENIASLQFELEISKVNYSNCAEIIRGMFQLPEEKLIFIGVINGKDYILPPKFDAGAFPDDCKIEIRYDYQKENQIKFRYQHNEEKLLKVDVDQPIKSIIPVIQEEFKLWHLSKSAIYLSFYTFDFPSNKSISYYKIPETVTIEIREKKETLPIQISTPENPKFENYYFVEGDAIADVVDHFQTQFKSEFAVYKNSKATKMMKIDTKLEENMKLYIFGEQKTIKCEGSIGDDEIEVSEILTVKEVSKYLSTKLNNKVYIFTKNEDNKSYESAEEDKRLSEYKEQLYAHKYFQTIDFNYVIFSKNEHISELNTINWLREKYISKVLLINMNDFIINKNKKRLKEADTIGQVLKKFTGKLNIYIKDKIQESKPHVSAKKFKPSTLNNILSDSSKSPQKKYIPAIPDLKERNVKMEKNDIDEEKHYSDEEKPEDFTQETKKIKKPIIKKKNDKKKKKVTSDSNSDSTSEEKNDSAKEPLSSNECEEEDKAEIIYNIQIGCEPVKKISLKKNATINDMKIKIAKEKDDIDPNCISILLAGKNLKKNIVIENLKLTKDDILQVSIQSFEEILYRTAKALQIYGDGNIEENYSEYDEENKEQETKKDSDKIKSDDDEGDDDFENSIKKDSDKIKSDDEDKKETKDGDKDDEKSDSSKEKDGNKELDLITLDLNNYKLLNKIGSGSYGEVYEIKDNRTGEIIAAKILFKPISATTNIEKRNLYRELNIMAKIAHPNIVKFIGFSPVNFHGEDKPIILTELVPNGSLEDLLKKDREKKSPKQWNDTHKLITIYSIALAMSFLHSHEIIHRDLKPANILMIKIDDKFYPKVADFGLSKMINSPEQNSLNIQSSSGMIGTPAYMAPEIITDLLYTKACDVYAFGIIVYEIITGTNPFEGLKQGRIFLKVASGERPKIKKSTPAVFKEFIESCWKQNPSKRPTFEKIVKELKENKVFITENINEDEYFSYIDYIDNHQTKFDVTRKIPSHYIRQD